MTVTRSTSQQTGASAPGPINAGLASSFMLNDDQGIVVSTTIAAGGWSLNHAEGIVVRYDPRTSAATPAR